MPPASSAQPWTLTRPAGRLDHFLARQLGLSRGAVRRLLRGGTIRVNHHIMHERDKGRMLQAGDIVQATAIRDPAMDSPQPNAALPLEVLAENDDLLIVNKPVGVAVHPYQIDETDTLLNAVVAYEPKIVGVGEAGLRSGVLHRLDTPTSGCVAFARHQSAYETWREAFTQHAVRKIYLTWVYGQCEGAEEAENWLAITQHKPARVRVLSENQAKQTPGARLCKLSWRTLETREQASLLEVTLHTGFLHQIRVMLAHRGHPIVGDTHYGSTSETATRLMLQAHELQLGALRAIAPVPVDFGVSVLE